MGTVYVSPAQGRKEVVTTSFDKIGNVSHELILKVQLRRIRASLKYLRAIRVSTNDSGRVVEDALYDAIWFLNDYLSLFTGLQSDVTGGSNGQSDDSRK